MIQFNGELDLEFGNASLQEHVFNELVLYRIVMETETETDGDPFMFMLCEKKWKEGKEEAVAIRLGGLVVVVLDDDLVGMCPVLFFHWISRLVHGP